MDTQYAVTPLLTDCTAVMLLSCCCHALSVTAVHRLTGERKAGAKTLFSFSFQVKIAGHVQKKTKDRRDNELEDKYGYCQNYSEHCTVQKSRIRLFPCSQCAELCAECAGRTVTIAASSDQPRHRATAVPPAAAQGSTAARTRTSSREDSSPLHCNTFANYTVFYQKELFRFVNKQFSGKLFYKQ